MDDLTRKVRGLYTAFPYPATDSGVRLDGFPRLLLSYLSGVPENRTRLHVLDAGCGAGLTILRIAESDPTTSVLGIDLNPTALDIVRTRIAERGLTNVSVAEVDLMTLEGLVTPDGGFDVILLSGVLHHLADPPAALRRLAGKLSPTGVVVAMVYGFHGRQSIRRLSEVIDLLHPDNNDVDARLQLARELFEAFEGSHLAGLQSDVLSSLPDIEIVDRYLHVHERAYTVTELHELFESAGLSMLRWLEPTEWSAESVVADGRVLDELRRLSPLERYEVIERIGDRHALTAIFCHQRAARREPARGAALLESTIDWNPQAQWTTTHRRDGRRVELAESTVQVRNQRPHPLDADESIVAALCEEPRTGAWLVTRAGEESGLDPALALAAIDRLVGREVLFVP